MKANKQIILALLVINLMGIGMANGQNKASEFVKVVGTHFEVKGKPYYFLGTNFWAGMNLGSLQEGGNRERLLRELDQLKALGITNLRVLAGSEGPATEPYRIIPAMQNEPGIYDENLLDGLDFLLAEMNKRDMYAVMCLNDYWQWSGGFGQYLVWAKETPTIPYPSTISGSWDVYQKFLSQFYVNKTAMTLYQNHIQKMVTRVNKYTNKMYKDDPAVFAWELANEPRGSYTEADYRKWIGSTSQFIKSLDKNHMVTTGSEGTPIEISGNDFEKDHAFATIDYTTLHIWIQNWGWYDPKAPEKTYKSAYDKAMAAIDRHIAMSKKMKKPLVLEEFGIARDKEALQANTPVATRDVYYNDIFNKVLIAAKAKTPLVGVNFWAWGGEGRPKHIDWQKGDDFLGDPPHEAQGWYSVFNTDKSTVDILKKYGTAFQNIK